MHPLLAAAILAAAVTLTYLCCVRPSLRGRGCGTPARTDADRLAALAQLRAELDALRQTAGSQSQEVDAGGVTRRPDGGVAREEADSR